MAQKQKLESTIKLAKSGTTSYTRIMGKPHTYKRSSISIKETPKTLEIRITANDAAALRASMNAMMRQIQVIESITGSDFRKSRGKDRTKSI